MGSTENKDWQIKISDVHRKIVLDNTYQDSESELTLSLHSLKSGVYFLQLINLNSNEISTKKLILFE